MYYYQTKETCTSGTFKCLKSKFQILFYKILKNKWYHAKVLLKRFHLNGHIIGFHPQTQKLELHYMSP